MIPLKVLAFFGLCNWRVRYHDGHVSRAMTKPKAKDYAAIFGGEIEPTKARIWDLGLK